MAEIIVRRVGVLSIAKIEGFLMFIVGLIVGVLYGLAFMLFGVTVSSFSGRSDSQALSGVSAVVIGLLIMIGVPIFYGIMGFIGGAIGGLIYNIASGIVGGIKLELEGVQQYAPPAAPPQWSPNPYAT